MKLHKIIQIIEMTYNVSSGMLNAIIDTYIRVHFVSIMVPHEFALYFCLVWFHRILH